MNTIQKWMLRAVFAILGFIGMFILGGGLAHADTPEPTQPIPGIVLPPELTTLADQANGAFQQAQADMATAGQQLQQAVTTALQPAPAPQPAVPPTVFGSPEADAAVTSVLPKSVPEIVQDVVDPAFEAGLSVIYEQPIKLPNETMSKDAPLSEQLAAAVDLFAVHQVAPNTAPCGSNTPLDETACAAGIVQGNKPGPESMATINVINRYGIVFNISPAGNPCFGTVLSLQYCNNNIMMSELMMSRGIAIENNDPSLGERIGVLAHEEGHHQDALRENEGRFFNRLKGDVNNVLASEQNADKAAGETLQNAVNAGDLSSEEGEKGFALFPRIGRVNEDGTHEATHGSPEMREDAANQGRELANDGRPSTREDYELVG